MRQSREEAELLLNKWMTESTPVSGTLMLCDIIISFSGLISSVTRHGFKIARTAEPGESTQMHFEIIIPFFICQGYEYRETREAPEQDRTALSQIIVSQLLISLQHYGNCAIFERVS